MYLYSYRTNSMQLLEGFAAYLEPLGIGDHSKLMENTKLYFRQGLNDFLALF